MGRGSPSSMERPRRCTRRVLNGCCPHPGDGGLWRAVIPAGAGSSAFSDARAARIGEAAALWKLGQRVAIG